MRRRQGTRLVPQLTALAVVGLAMLAGCAQSAALPPQTVTSLHVIRTSAFPANRIPPFERTASDAIKVQRLYNALMALPAFPSGTFSCPVDFGVVYHLTFFHQSAIALRADVKPDGCQGVSFNGANRGTKWVATSPQFWVLFADTLDVPESAVYPVIPQPEGSFAAPAVL